jgi:ABC-type polysaccharide transport system permease subunit
VYNISLGTRSTNTISMATAIGILKSLVSIVLLFLANTSAKPFAASRSCKEGRI